MREFLSDEWCVAALGALQAGRGASGLDARVQFESTRSNGGAFRWGLVIVDGRAVELRLGEIDAGVLLRSSVQHAWSAWAGTCEPAAALDGFTVIEHRDRGPWSGPLAPMDLGAHAELDELPTLADATLDVHYRYAEGPFGPVAFAIGFVDGRVVSLQLGEVPAADVVVECTFLQMGLVRRGDLTILDVLAAGGQVDGSVGALGLLGGISESPAFRRAEQACGASGVALGVLGALRADPAVAAATAALFADTSTPAADG